MYLNTILFYIPYIFILTFNTSHLYYESAHSSIQSISSITIPSTLLNYNHFSRNSETSHILIFFVPTSFDKPLTFEQRKYGYIRIEKFEVSRFAVFRVISNTNLPAVLLTRLFTQSENWPSLKRVARFFQVVSCIPPHFFLCISGE